MPDSTAIELGRLAYAGRQWRRALLELRGAGGELDAPDLERLAVAVDLERALEWTSVLNDWCGTDPDVVPYRGQCLVHRSELYQFRGDWERALQEARLAIALLSGPPVQPTVGLAHYQLGELHRLRGDHRQAEEAYRQANHHGHAPQPGLALLRLAQDRHDVAEMSIRRLVDEATDFCARTKMLTAHVDIMLAIGDLEAVHRTAADLRALAEQTGSALLRATSSWATGAELAATGHHDEALELLQAAAATWQSLDAPYLASRARALAGRTLQSLGDTDAAAFEGAAARAVFESVGAVPDLDQLAAGTGTADTRRTAGLTAREVEVLRLVAAGGTNRSIAEELVISEKTVERHLGNIFTKLGVTNRTAASAWAFNHDLV